MKRFFTNLFTLFSSKNPESSSDDERERLLDYMILAITEGNNLVDRIAQQYKLR